MKLLRSLYHYLLAWLGSVWYGHPSRQIFVLGVTGTKGKSTVIELINSILTAAGKKTAVVSSVRFKNDTLSNPNLTGMTMPGRFFIQNLLILTRRLLLIWKRSILKRTVLMKITATAN